MDTINLSLSLHTMQQRAVTTTNVHTDHLNPQRLFPHSLHNNTVNALLFDDDVAAALAQAQRTRAVRPMLQSPHSMLLCFIFFSFVLREAVG